MLPKITLVSGPAQLRQWIVQPRLSARELTAQSTLCELSQLGYLLWFWQTVVLQKIFRQIVHHLEKKVRFIKRDWVVSTGSIFIRQDVTKTDQILHHTVYGFGNLRFLQLA